MTAKVFRWFKRNWLNAFCYLVFAFFLCTNVFYLWRGDLYYHTDIARDFLILDEMVSERKLSLIGARTSIAGVFHGPAWYYLNLPVFFLSGGNPLATGWFWLALALAAGIAFYFCAQKIANKKTALLAIALLASLKIALPVGLMQSGGAFFISFIYFFLLWWYTQKQRWWQLALAAFTAGLLIQFQMAFGGPILVVTGVYSLYQILKNKKYWHLLSWLAILLPLSTFLLFDWRHDFLQLNSIINYFTSSSNGGADFSLAAYLQQRLTALIDCFALVTPDNNWLRIPSSLLTLAFLIWAGFLVRYDKKSVRSAYSLSMLMIAGFWLVTLPFKGPLWDFYYDNLLPLIVFWVAYVVIIKNDWWWKALLLLAIICNFYAEWRWIAIYTHDGVENHEIFWSFYDRLASDIYQSAQGQEFSHYVYTPNLYAYQAKYALRYWANQHQQPYLVNQKEPLTFLVIGGSQHADFTEKWQIEDVKIARAADEEWSYASGYRVKKYLLTEEEMKIEDNPFLIENLEFR